MTTAIPHRIERADIARAPGTFWAAGNCLATPLANQNGMEWNMSDPIDPYHNDRSRRYGARRSDFWPWLTAALTALGLLIGWAIGYNWGVDHERRAQSSPPTTTGSAPSQQQPAPAPSAPNL